MKDYKYIEFAARNMAYRKANFKGNFLKTQKHFFTYVQVKKKKNDKNLL